MLWSVRRCTLWLEIILVTIDIGLAAHCFARVGRAQL